MSRWHLWIRILTVLGVAVAAVIGAMDGELCFARCERPANHLRGERAYMMAAGPVMLLLAVLVNAFGNRSGAVNSGKRFVELSLLALSLGLMIWAHIGPM